MKWVGLTGGIASGKSSVTKIIRDYGLVVIDADEIAREVVIPESAGLKSIIKEFGVKMLNQDGTLNRQKLADLVFKDRNKLIQLENILHPLIKNEVDLRKQECKKSNQIIAFYDVPLLFEKKLEKDFDEIVLVSCSKETQKDRMKMRDGLSDEQIENRLSMQIPITQKEKQSNYVIVNESDIVALSEEVVKMLKHYHVKV